MKATIKYQRGFTLVTLIFLMATMSVAITTGYVLMASSMNSFAGIEEENALAVAQAGLDTSIKYIQSALLGSNDWTLSSGSYNPSGNLTGNISGGTFTVTFLNPEADRVTVQSIGTVGGATRTVTLGLARVPEGSNYAVYCSDSVSGINIQSSSHVIGNIYTNAPISYYNNTDTTPIEGAVYHKTGVTVTSTSGPRRPLEWHTDISPAYSSTGGNAITCWRNKWDYFKDICADAGHYYGWTSFSGWSPGHSYSYSTGGQYKRSYDIDLTSAGDVIINTTGTGSPATIYIGGDLTISNGARLVISSGARVNIIVAGQLVVNSGSSIVQQSTYPTYIWVGYNNEYYHSDDEYDDHYYHSYAGKFKMQGTSIINATKLRIMCRDFYQSGTGDAATRYPGNGEFTLFVNSSFDMTSAAPQELAANLILDRIDLSLTSTSRIYGNVYCFDSSSYYGSSSYVTLSNSSGIYGTVVSNNSQSHDCLTTYSSSFVSESTARWRPPATPLSSGEPYMPFEIGTKPTNTGGYGVWQEP